MDNKQMEVGDMVVASYKSGRYIGRIVEITSTRKAAVEILAVLKHPEQGDLHNPMQADVAMFHQRRALSCREIALMPVPTIEPYAGTVPEYADSLQRAVQSQIQELDNLQRWANRSLTELQTLEKEYFGG